MTFENFNKIIVNNSIFNILNFNLDLKAIMSVFELNYQAWISIGVILLVPLLWLRLLMFIYKNFFEFKNPNHYTPAVLFNFIPHAVLFIISVVVISI